MLACYLQSHKRLDLMSRDELVAEVLLARGRCNKAERLAVAPHRLKLLSDIEVGRVGKGRGGLQLEVGRPAHRRQQCKPNSDLACMRMLQAATSMLPKPQQRLFKQLAYLIINCKLRPGTVMFELVTSIIHNLTRPHSAGRRYPPLLKACLGQAILSPSASTCYEVIRGIGGADSGSQPASDTNLNALLPCLRTLRRDNLASALEMGMQREDGIYRGCIKQAVLAAYHSYQPHVRQLMQTGGLAAAVFAQLKASGGELLGLPLQEPAWAPPSYSASRPMLLSTAKSSALCKVSTGCRVAVRNECMTAMGVVG
jgi:hypothetical protein